MLDEKSMLPKYVQIAELLKLEVEKYIREGEDKFLSDDELKNMFSVSRMTIRQAVQLLVEERILKRVQGKGTYIIYKEKLETDIAKLDTFFRGWYLNTEFNVKLLHRGVVECPKDIALKLGVNCGDEVYQVKRLRMSKETPIVIDNRYLLKKYGEVITDEEYIKYSFSHIFLRKFGWTFTEGELDIEAILADDNISKILSVAKDSPILHRKVDLKVKSFGCVLTGDSFYRGDMYKYKAVLKDI